MTKGVPGPAERLWRLLPAAYALAAPVVFLPNSVVDAYILPRTALALLFGAGLGALALRRSAGRSPLAWAGVAVAVAAVLAALLSVNADLSLAGAYTRYESLPLRLAYLGLFAGGAVLLAGPAAAGARHLAVNAFVAGSSIAAVEAIVQLVTHSLDRPDGNLGQANLLGALLAMAIPLSLQVGFRSWPWLVTLPVLCLGLFASSSRSGWLAALVGCLAVLVVVVPARARRWGAVAGGVLVAAALAALVVSPLRTLNNDTGSARIGVWGDGLRMAAARPLTGWGEEATGLVFGRFQSADWEPGDTFDRIHDEPIDLLVTQGLLGLGACAGFWALVAWALVRATRATPGGARALPIGTVTGALAAYAAWALLNFDWAPATGPFWLLGGLAWAEASGVRAPSADRRPLWAWTAAALVALVAAALAGLDVAADRAYYAGQPARAAALAPWQAQYHRVHAEALPAGAPERLAELERARDLGEYDYQFFIELGDAARAAGRIDEARAAYRRAEEIYRFDPTAAQRLAALGR